MIEIIIILVGATFLGLLLYATIMPLTKKKKNQNKQQTEEYITPEFKPLTQEEINDIHSRGKITPAEKVMEWERMNACVSADEMWTSAWRCKKFKSCHDCLVDYASETDEYVPSLKE